jgi:hypothetical protein
MPAKVVVRTPYPTMEQTAAVLGVPMTRVRRIEKLVQEVLTAGTAPPKPRNRASRRKSASTSQPTKP